VTSAVKTVAVARRLSALPLPSSTFVAGRTVRPPPGWFDHVDDADHFAFGCDLFDAGFFFEAHELWECCWHATKARLGATDDPGLRDDEAVLRALIHLAAAGVKLLDDKTASRQRHVQRARALFVADAARRRGLDPAVVLAAADALFLGQRPELA
jgi:hypothetical protein